MAAQAEEREGRLEAKMMKLAEFSAKISGEVHLAAIKDTFSVIVPIYVLGGLAILINNVILPLFLSDEALTAVSVWGNTISNGTLNTMSIVVAGVLSYMYAQHKGFENKLSCGILGICSFFIIMPLTVEATLASDADATAAVTGAFITGNLGAAGLFAAMIASLVSASLFIKLSDVKRLKINLGEGVPPMVTDTFNGLIPIMIVMAIFGGVSLLTTSVFGMDPMAIIRVCISEPLKALGDSALAIFIIYMLANALWIIGVHNSTIQGSVLDPIMMMAITENMSAFAAGQPAPHILTYSFYVWCQMGGSGCLLALVLDTFLFSKNKAKRTIANMAVVPGIFNIAEPVLFGYPIVFNLTLGIPFMLAPAFNFIVMYAATAAGLIGRAVAMVPWTTPPVISGFIATAGDWRAAVLMAILLVCDMAIYLPFLKADDRMAAKKATEAEGQE